MNKESLKIGFVILHYMTERDTDKAIKSIIDNIDIEDYHIVVVDNASSNDSVKFLIEKYDNNRKVNIIRNKKNLGFANGNNVGINYLNTTFQVEFICCLNNDVILMEKNLYLKVNNEFLKSNFSVLGPLILSGDGRYDSNPQRYSNLSTIPDINRAIKRYKKILILNKFNLYWLYAILKSIKNKFRSLPKELIIPSREINVQLSGACLIFSRNYFKKYEGFFDKTFLYKEEDIMYYLLMSNSLISVFSPDIIVYHMEDSSTNFVLNNNKKKIEFVYKNYIKSLEEFKKII